MTSFTGPALNTRVSSNTHVSSLPYTNSINSMEHIAKQLATPSLPPKKQIALVDELCSSCNFDVNDVVIDIDGVSPKRLIDVAVEDGKNGNKEFATYLVVEKGANLKLCDALYELDDELKHPDWRTEALLNTLVIELDEQKMPLQFQFSIEGKPYIPAHGSSETSEITLNLSLQEAKKLTQICTLFSNEWTNSNNKGDPRLIAPPHIDLPLFENAIYAALGRTVEQTAMAPEDISSLIKATNFLDMADSSAVICALVTADSLAAYVNANIDDNTLTPEEQQTLAESPDTLNQQIRQKLENLQNCQDNFVHMALYTQSDANHQFATTAVTQLNQKNMLDIERHYAMLLHVGNSTNSDLQCKRIAQLMTAIASQNPAAKTLFKSTQDCEKMLTKMLGKATSPDTKMAIANAIGEIAGLDAERAMLIHMGNHADSDPLREAIANRIFYVTNGIAATERIAIRAMLMNMGRQANSEQTRQVIVDKIRITINGISTATEAAVMHDFLIQMSHQASSDPLRQAIASTINIITPSDISALFATQTMLNRLIDMAEQASSDQAKKEIAEAIGKIIGIHGSTLFVDERVRDVLIEMGNQASTDSARNAIASAIIQIIEDDPTRQNLFTNPAMCNMLIQMANQADSDPARFRIIEAINCLIQNHLSEFISFTSSTMMHDMLVNVGCKTSSYGAIAQIEKLITLIINESQQGLDLISTPEINDMLTNMESRIHANGLRPWDAWQKARVKITARLMMLDVADLAIPPLKPF